MKIERGTKLLVDTNVLLESTDEGRRHHALALGLFRGAADAGVDLFVGTQVIREYLVVATRPVKNNGLGMATVDALDNVGQFLKRAGLVAETLRAGETFVDWAGRYEVRGKKLHDLQILATASSAGMDALVTANKKDFQDIPAIQVMPLSEIEFSQT